MENKVQEITEKIYREGVEKGQTEAQKLIAQAEEDSAALLQQATQEAEAIIAAARKQAAELDRNTRSELSLYASRALETLKSEVADMVTDAIVHAAVKETVTAEYLQKLMLSLTAEWSKSGDVVIQTADAETLKQYFVQHAATLLDKGVRIEQVNGKPASFAIQPAAGGYKVQFGEAEFTDFFKDFLRPHLSAWLFQ
jgi:V/A-type H+-transporting ATPase subunit E